MKRSDHSELQYLLSSRPLLIKRNGMHLCLHDAFSGEVLAGQSRIELIQECGQVATLRVEFNCDGRHVRLEGE
jgi:hypothetical protein